MTSADAYPSLWVGGGCAEQGNMGAQKRGKHVEPDEALVFQSPSKGRDRK